MSNLSNDKNKDRKKEFFSRLDQLILEYPELTTPYHTPDCDHEDEDPDFDPSAPKVITGVILLVTTCDLNNYEGMFLERPYEQSHFHTLGMVHAALERIL